MLLLTDVKKNRAFCMWIGRPSAARATKHRGMLLLGDASRLGWSSRSSSMHLDRAAMDSTCSSVGVMHTGLYTFRIGMLNVFRLSGTCSSQKARRLWRGRPLAVLDRGDGGPGDAWGRTLGNARWNALASPVWELCGGDTSCCWKTSAGVSVSPKG